MNETLQVINSRRSIRSYKREQIGNAEIQAIVHAGLYAPNARNLQKWHFTVVRKKSVLDNLKHMLKEAMLKSENDFQVKRASEPGFVAFYDAPTVIILSADENSNSTQIDCGAAAENMALAAESLNIGSCLMTSSGLILNPPQGNDLLLELGVPKGYRHICCLALGYKNCENPSAPTREENLVNFI